MTTEQTARTVIVLSFMVVLAVILSTRWQSAQPEQDSAESGDRIVASIGTRLITLREVEQTVALSLYQADQQRSQLLHQALHKLIEEELLKAEASRKGVTVSQLVADSSQSESIARLADLPAPVKRLTPGKGRDSVNQESPRDPQEQA
ncbi:MAG TPA: SurA N-terminal domain-containing protein, partial [Nitrospiraceae bacterium]|nr:SurA N-terminal domain-containing protein [Nitrospiraceae bacterium]